MHKTFVTALAAATLFAVALPANRAEAIPAATPSAVGIAHSSVTPLVREAAIICGGNGCNPVHTKAVKRSKFKPLDYTKPVGKTS
jgi:hypothetical protein